jgi:hypothetical protein
MGNRCGTGDEKGRALCVSLSFFSPPQGLGSRARCARRSDGVQTARTRHCDVKDAPTSSLAAVSISNVSTKRNRRKGVSERPWRMISKSRTGKSNLYLVIGGEAIRKRRSLFYLVLGF